MSDAQTSGDPNISRAPTDAPSPIGLRTIPSSELLDGAREVLIQHGQETYRLRVTKAGKLILNK